MNDLFGTRCEALVAQEFWRDECPLRRASYLYLRTNTGGATGWCFNEDSEEWHAVRLENTDLEPIEPYELDGSIYSYPHTDLAAKYGLRGKPLACWLARKVDAVAEARLQFADGSVLVFEYDFQTERDSIRFEPPVR